MTARHGLFRHAFLLLVLSLGLGLAGCEGDDGAPGRDGADGTNGADGADGQACWDLNNNGIGDPEEDINGDGVVDVYDCNAYASGAYEIDQLHAGYFTEYSYEGTQSCLNCHGLMAEEVLETAHFKWEGVAQNIVGDAQGQIHGKKDILNNFCIGVPSNEGRCTQCHAGYGWVDNTFDFQDPENIDCLVCHDQTGTYAKAKPNGGLPADPAVLQAVARSVAMGRPSIDNCIFCHANAGGGDNVKHGDLAMSLANTTAEYDVHMGVAPEGKDFECVDCHLVKRDLDDKLLSHGIGGMPYHSVDEGEMKTCESCHGTAANIHAAKPVAVTVNSHPTLACQVCHIPAIARETSTKTEWYWDSAGEVRDPPNPVDPVDPTRVSFDRMKGDFVWAFNVRPTLRRFNGTWQKTIIGVNDTYEAGFGTPENPIVLGAPVGSPDDGMIYPFKKMIGNQPADVGFRRILVPHLFGTAGGPTPFWGNWDWTAALAEGAAATEQPFSGEVGFVYTEMYLSVNHEVAPAEMAFGYDNGGCTDCHTNDQIDWAALGYDGDPINPN